MEKRKQIEKVKKQNDKNRLICDLALGKLLQLRKARKPFFKKDLRFLQSSSYKEYKVNALASEAEEGRDKLRKAAGSCK